MPESRQTGRSGRRGQQPGRAAAQQTDDAGAHRVKLEHGLPLIMQRSLYHGVEWDPHIQKWRSRITVKGRKLSLGSFASETHAAM